MKEDVVAANLANLRQSINELKECVNRQNVTPNQPEQHIKVDLDEKTIYNGVAKSFCTCWNDALSVVKKHIWNQQPDTLLHIPEHTRSLSGSLLGYKTIP